MVMMVEGSCARAQVTFLSSIFCHLQRLLVFLTTTFIEKLLMKLQCYRLLAYLPHTSSASVFAWGTIPHIRRACMALS
jgi:hypothetical protein